MAQDEKRSNFIRLAESRTDNALRYIKSIGKLANKSSYEYNEKDYKAIFSALEAAIREAKNNFQGKKKHIDKFKLE